MSFAYADPPAARDASHATAAEPGASAAAARDTSARAADDASPGTGGTRRICAWCRGPIPAAARRDAVCCSVRCRQARHRFLPEPSAGQPSQAAGRYGWPTLTRPTRATPGCTRGTPTTPGEVDHATLIRRLGPYDGWALSTSG